LLGGLRRVTVCHTVGTEPGHTQQMVSTMPTLHELLAKADAAAPQEVRDREVARLAALDSAQTTGDEIAAVLKEALTLEGFAPAWGSALRFREEDDAIAFDVVVYANGEDLRAALGTTVSIPIGADGLTVQIATVGLRRSSTGISAESTVAVHSLDDGTPTLHRDELLAALESLIPALAIGAPPQPSDDE